MTRQPIPALPRPSLCPTRQYGTSVTTPQRCQCSLRWECEECREYWVRRRQRTCYRWLEDALREDGQAWFAHLTIPAKGDWTAETNELFLRWSKLGKARSQQRFRAKQDGLACIRRGIGCLHLVNESKAWQPHLHAVLVTDRTTEDQSLVNNWQAMGVGYAEVELARSLGAVVRYSIAGPLPSDCEKRRMLSEALKGVRMIRRIGR